MSVATLEREIVAVARGVLNRPRLKKKDLQEWSTSEEVVKANAREDEVVVYLPVLQIWAAFKKEVARNSRS